eukprot:2502411-Alexandrium_andersonii.AAC.1
MDIRPRARGGQRGLGGKPHGRGVHSCRPGPVRRNSPSRRRTRSRLGCPRRGPRALRAWEARRPRVARRAGARLGGGHRLR